MQRRAVHDSNQLRADQVCVYRHDDVDRALRSLLLVVEYKPPHKLTLPHLRLSLRKMDIQHEVVNRTTIPTDKDELFSYHADKVVAAAICQTYHYMITGGLTYSYVTTGEAIVFLKIDWRTPEHLLFHLAEPRAEVLAHPHNAVHCTAVSQVLAFTLLAIEEQHSNPGQDDRVRAMGQLGRWCVDHDAILKAVPESVRKQTPPPSAYAARDYGRIDRSPYFFRNRLAVSTCRPASGGVIDDELSDLSDDGSGGFVQNSPSLRDTRRHPQTGQRRAGGSNNTPAGSATSQRQYCTQKCLLGLVRGGLLHKACPNADLHQQGSSQTHPVGLETWLQLLRDQLAGSHDKNIVPLGKQGARGVAFQVTLAEYGYTVVAKCTVPEFVVDLEHEGSMYKTLEPLQGIQVPVFLGAFHLERPYYYDHRVQLVYMMLLSWAGEPIDTHQQCSPELTHARRSAVSAVAQLGVVHGDERDNNTLWCSETNDVMLIDFERSTLAPVSPVMPSQRVRSNRRPRIREPLLAIATNRRFVHHETGLQKTRHTRSTRFYIATKAQ
ncbi:uncharacterized protein B0I36DRAFT_337757 [Microdochium trichocladiopsis]|uniref:Protein kinase domain-containing protein n=1 Tax=Microdochium trichocladiopsis TaxID=1682393 RepID=A0A9P8XTG4_9PEZI|nr:uncharacterized protein B0I36DRAFT_337757 [Microdochium trichocladiopsis]KAH7016457.1 hypothetical protein B0I36DRAFT_337757 [Microdochium trichocladiopsis]